MVKPSRKALRFANEKVGEKSGAGIISRQFRTG